MEKLINAQNLLLRWFKAQGGEHFSLTKIKYLCRELNEQFDLQLPNKDTYYRIVLPLIRLGLIDFHGLNRVALAPSIFLINTKSIIGVNIPNRLNKTLEKENVEGAIGEFGIINYPIEYEPTIQKVAIEHHYLIQSTNQKNILKNLPSLKKVALTLLGSKEMLLTTDDFEHLSFNKGWTKNNKLSGIYRATKEVFSNRYFFDGMDWFSFDSTQNPDTFNILACYAYLINDWDLGISYSPKTKKIIVRQIYFPILLSRLLLLGTIGANQNISIAINKGIYSNISQNTFFALNRIFAQKITINEKSL